jgi:fructoselysine and glucoselysine-specific PTS system IIB component
MIEQLRVDDRLIHGQVALMWSKVLGTKGIIVANDGAANDKMVAATLKMACPSSQKLLIKTVSDVKQIINDPRSKKMSIFLLVNCVKDALALVEASQKMIKEVNIANVGRFVNSDKAKIFASVELTSDEFEAARKLCTYNIPVFHQVTPIDPKLDFASAINEQKN